MTNKEPLETEALFVFFSHFQGFAIAIKPSIIHHHLSGVAL